MIKEILVDFTDIEISERVARKYSLIYKIADTDKMFSKFSTNKILGVNILTKHVCFSIN